MLSRRNRDSVSGGTPVTSLVMGLNIGVHLVLAGMLLAQPERIDRILYVFRTFALVPERFWGEAALWQPLTSMFLHGILIGLPVGPDGYLSEVPSSARMLLHLISLGSLHVAVNMIALWSLGRPIEQTLGSRRFATLYFVSGLGGGLLTLLLDMSGPRAAIPSVGASGAVVGILGALAIFFPHSRLLVFFIPMQARTAALGLGAVSLFLLISDSGGFISHTGHLGGLIGGLLYSRFALHLQVAQEQLAGLPGGLRRTFLRAPKARPAAGNAATSRPLAAAAVSGASGVSAGSGAPGVPVRTLVPGESLHQSVVYDPKTGRFFLTVDGVGQAEAGQAEAARPAPPGELPAHDVERTDW